MRERKKDRESNTDEMGVCVHLCVCALEKERETEEGILIDREKSDYIMQRNEKHPMIEHHQ